MIQRTLLILLRCTISLLPLVQGDAVTCDQGLSDGGVEEQGLFLLQAAMKPTAKVLLAAPVLAPETPEESPWNVTIFKGVWCVLALSSIAYYLYSTGASDEPKLPESPVQAHAQDDDVIRRSTSSRIRLTRRATITVSEIARSAKYQTWHPEDAVGTLGGGAFVITILCDIAPNGIVPLPHGLLGTGFLPTIALLLAFYGCCVCTMWMIARTSFITGKMSFTDQWSALIGPSTSWIPIAVVISVCFGNCVEYLCFVADLLTGCLPAFGLPLSRTHCAWLFAMFPALPLCFLKDLSALAPTSVFGFASVVYLVFVMCLRLYDGSYSSGGIYFQDLPSDHQPAVPKEHMFEMGTSSLVLLNALAMAFLPHYNGPKYYRELQNHNPYRFFKCTALGMGLAGILYVSAMIVGYKTFGTATQAVITQSYARTDMLMNVARLCLGISILASFPIMFSGLREAIVQLLTDFASMQCNEVWKQNSITTVLVTLIAFLTQLLTDPGMVVGLVGAVCGIACIFLLPCTLYSAALSVDVMATNVRLQLMVTGAFKLLGVFLMVGGVYATFNF